MCCANAPPSSEEQVCDLSPHFDCITTKQKSLGKFTFISVLSHHTDSPINYKAAELRVAKYKALPIRSPSSDLRCPTIAPVLPDPWENLCPDANNNPHQYLVVHTLTGEEWTPHQGEIFSIPSAGLLLHHPPDFPSVFPFFTTLYHHQAFSPAPTVIIGLPAGACPIIKACGQAVRIEPSPDIPLGYIRLAFQRGIWEAFTHIPPYCHEAYRGHLVLLDHFNFLDRWTISTYGYLEFEGRAHFCMPTILPF